MWSTNRAVGFLLVLCCCGFLASAQEKAKDEGSATPTGFRGEFLSQMADVEKKLEDLAQAMPQEKYSWRPMEGVRSVSEVYMHIADGNFELPSLIGFGKPEGVDANLEKTTTDKTKVLEVLKQSFEHMRQAVLKTSDADLEKSVKMFGRPSTVMGVIFHAALHMHEHLGQSIAYARMNNIVPPWTAAEQAQQKKDAKK